MKSSEISNGTDLTISLCNCNPLVSAINSPLGIVLWSIPARALRSVSAKELSFFVPVDMLD